MTRKNPSVPRVVGACRLLAARVGESLTVVVVLASLVFFALRWLPGDPARLILGDDAGAADLARVRSNLRLDDPILVQYARFLRGLATLDLGESYRRPGTRAMARILGALAPTAELAGLAVALGAALGIAVAVAASGPWLAGRAARQIDRALVVLASLPLVAFAPVLTWIFAARAHICPLPGDPDAGLAGLVFGATLLAVPLSAHVGRVARAALSDVARAEFLHVAAAKGAGPWRVWVVHALPAAAGPIATVVTAQLGALLGGAVVLERLFERWGLGTVILDAYASRDLPVLEGAVVVSGLLFVLVQSLGVAVHAAVDPRVRGDR